MIEQFRNKRFNSRKTELLEYTQGIMAEYARQGIALTLRQLYYQLVARGVIPNEIRQYKNLSVFATDARYGGYVDWNAIEDRIRRPSVPGEWENTRQMIDQVMPSYRLPRWRDQDKYVELLTEKDALSSVLQPLASKYHIPYCVNRGYTSASSIYDLRNRLYYQVKVEGKKVVILYLGDHDPSGLDMIRDIKDRLHEMLESPFAEKWIDFEDNVQIIQVALTMEQIKQYDPPPNPAKLTDTRARWYIEKWGESCWEVDALPPDKMIRIVENAIKEHIDLEKYEAIKELECKQRKQVFDLLDGKGLKKKKRRRKKKKGIEKCYGKKTKR